MEIYLQQRKKCKYVHSKGRNGKIFIGKERNENMFTAEERNRNMFTAAVSSTLELFRFLYILFC